jgi:predicted small secreted protein
MGARICTAILLAFSLSACGTMNTGIGNVQVNGEAIPLPSNYKEAVARAIEGRPMDGPLLISEPTQIPGEGDFDPKRWAVCVRGLSPGKAKPARKPLLDLSDVLDPPEATGVYEAIVVFYRNGIGKPKLVFDAPLCRQLVFKPAQQ